MNNRILHPIEHQECYEELSSKLEEFLVAVQQKKDPRFQGIYKSFSEVAEQMMTSCSSCFNLYLMAGIPAKLEEIGAKL